MCTRNPRWINVADDFWCGWILTERKTKSMLAHEVSCTKDFSKFFKEFDCGKSQKVERKYCGSCATSIFITNVAYYLNWQIVSGQKHILSNDVINTKCANEHA